ncbi:MAG: tRNA (N(6)-L-threonylcarbamoyladenosine(37)-C(2))-methylthiotransferase [Candidatus Micrarchaeota archaeon]
MKVFVEGYGCSANLAETEQIKGFVQTQNFELADNPAMADIIIVNTCAVKKRTEFAMQRRIRFLCKVKKPGCKIIASGCLSKINPNALQQFGSLTPAIVQTGTELQEISTELGVKEAEFSPALPQVRFHEKIEIIPIAKGCLSACSFCGTRFARGKLRSFPVFALNEKFRQSIGKTPEIWLASQDNGCYGFDLKTDLPSLVQTLLSNEGDFRIRLGMLSPQYVQRYYDEFVSLFSDERLYRFIHLPLQSGNNRVLSEMKRQYTADYFTQLVSDLRKDIGEFSLSTDIIAGFPTETKPEFKDTLELVETIGFDTVNISRFGVRPNTGAAAMIQMTDREKTIRSHELHRLCRNMFLKANQKLVGRTEKVLISEKAKINGFVGRTNCYKPVVVPDAVLGEFAVVQIREAFPNFVKGIVVEKQPIGRIQTR